MLFMKKKIPIPLTHIQSENQCPWNILKCSPGQPQLLLLKSSYKCQRTPHHIP